MSNKATRLSKTATEGEPTSIRIGLGWTATLAPTPAGVTLRMEHAVHGEPVEIEVTLSASGPVIRARAPSIEMSTDGSIDAHCRRFSVHATESIELTSRDDVRIEADVLEVLGREQVSVTSGGDLTQTVRGASRIEASRVSVHATRGDVALKANDDVQLKGELILLNTDRPEPQPDWMRDAVAPQNPLPVESISGDRELARLVEDHGTGK